MASDFTIIIKTRHRFGDEPKGSQPDPAFGRDERNLDADALFVGTQQSFQFSCPLVDPSEWAVLQFEHRGTTQYYGNYRDPETDEPVVGLTPEHPVSINGVVLPGGVPGAPFRNNFPFWAHRLLLIPELLLREEENVLNIRSLDIFSRGREINYDDFTIDNAVVFYKTLPRVARPPAAQR